jgi:cytochrome P450
VLKQRCTDTPEIFDENQRIRLFLPETMRCPQPAYAELRSKCPVGRMFFTNSPVVSHFKDVQDALRDPETFSSAIDLRLGNVRPMIPQQLDPPAQTRYRRLLDPLFSRKKMAALVPAIREHAAATRASASSTRRSRSRCRVPRS